MDNNYIIRTIRYNSKDGKPFLVSWPASKYVASPKGTTIQQHSIKVQAKIYSPEVYKDYNLNFERSGDTYTLTGVTDGSGTNVTTQYKLNKKENSVKLLRQINKFK